MRRLWVIAAALLAILMAALPAAGQPRQAFDPLATETQTPRRASERDVIAVGARFGLGGVWTLERFAPVRVLLDGGGRAYSGVLEVSYRQDVTQETVQRVPFAVTPNAVAEVEVIVCPASNTDRIRVVVRDDRGRRLGGRDFVERGRSGTQLPLGVRESGPLIVSTTESGLEFGLDAWARRVSGDGQPVVQAFGSAAVSEPWSAVRVTRVSERGLPRSWAGLDAASALVVRAEQILSIEPDAAEAVAGWLNAGGVLVVLANGTGPEYQLWPSTEAAGAVGRYVRAAPPASLSVERGDAERVLERHAEVTSGVEVEEEDGSWQLKPTETVTGRAMRLTEAGERNGWRLRWPTDGGGMLAEGPLGLGWVVVLGVDPSDLADGPQADVTAAMWTDALAVFDRQPWQPSGWWGGWGSGARTEHSRAISGAIEATLRVSPVGLGVAILLLGGGLVLVLLVGPIDAIVLHRLRLSHRSWLTAIGWIVLAGGAALAYPRLVRDGGGVLARYEAIDARLDDAGYGAAARTAVTSVYAGRTGPMAYSDPPAGSWMRGVSSQTYGGGVVSLPALRVGQFRLAEGDVTARTGWPGLGLRERDAGRDAAQRMWTLRTVMDVGSPTDVPLPTCRLALGPAPELRLSEIAASASSVTVAVRRSESWYSGSLAGSARARDEDGLIAVPLRPAQSVPADWDPSADAVGGGTRMWYGPNQPIRAQASASLLPGAIRRSVAIERLVEDGSRALVLIGIEHAEPLGPGGLRVEPTGREERMTVFRLVVPVEADRD